MSKATKQLFSLYLFKYSGKDICEINSNDSDPFNCKLGLPHYTFNTKHKNIIDSDCYFQFFKNPDHLDEDQKEEIYILFDYEHADFLLSEEISQGGWDSIFEQFEQDGFYEFINTLPDDYFNIYKDNHLHRNVNIVMDIEYVMSYSCEYGITEVSDVKYHLLGYLDDNMEFVEWEKDKP